MQDQLQALNHQVIKKINLSKHIAELLETITRDQPADPIGCYEEMSKLIWKLRHVQETPVMPSVPQEELNRCQETLDLLGKLDSPARSKVDTLFFEMAPKWAAYGITMSKDNALMLQCSLIGLAEKEEIAGLRFWGTFSTPNGLIYVAEADIPLEHHSTPDFLPPVGQYDVPAEIGVGVNRYVYYYTKSPFDPWQRLPDVRPSDIVSSRKVTWQISGDFSAAVRSFVPFDVTEDIYIRALIARISSACIAAPSGYMQEYVPEEEEEAQEQPEEDGEEKPKPPKQLKLVLSPDFESTEIDGVEWVHVRPFILPQGREKYIKAPKPPKQPKEKKPKPEKEETNGEEEGEEEEQKQEEPEEDAPEEEEQPEEGPELFGAINDDEGFGEEQPAWNFRTINSPIPANSFVVAESLRWPGAFNLTDGKKSCSIYMGTGTKFVVDGFQPPSPPSLAGEYKLKMTERIDPTLDEEKEFEKRKNPPKEEEEEEEQNE